MNPLDILSPAPRRAYRTPLTARLLGWLVDSPAPRRALADDMTAAARREALR